MTWSELQALAKKRVEDKEAASPPTAFPALGHQVVRRAILQIIGPCVDAGSCT
jgi:hypothetical protein